MGLSAQKKYRTNKNIYNDVLIRNSFHFFFINNMIEEEK
jgi:hypothetical protein